MRFTDYIHFFTPVSDGLPSNEEWVYCKNSLFSSSFCYYSDGCWYNGKGQKVIVTHWLNPENLTTKQRAIELAEKAWVGGHKYCESDHDPSVERQSYNPFIAENKNIL